MTDDPDDQQPEEPTVVVARAGLADASGGAG